MAILHMLKSVKDDIGMTFIICDEVIEKICKENNIEKVTPNEGEVFRMSGYGIKKHYTNKECPVKIDI